MKTTNGNQTNILRGEFLQNVTNVLKGPWTPCCCNITNTLDRTTFRYVSIFDMNKDRINTFSTDDL